MERRTNEHEETREFDHTDFYQMYQDEMDCIVPCTAQEMEVVGGAFKWKRDARKRLVEGCLFLAAEIERQYQNKGFPEPGILVQEPIWLF